MTQTRRHEHGVGNKSGIAYCELTEAMLTYGKLSIHGFCVLVQGSEVWMLGLSLFNWIRRKALTFIYRLHYFLRKVENNVKCFEKNCTLKDFSQSLPLSCDECYGHNDKGSFCWSLWRWPWPSRKWGNHFCSRTTNLFSHWDASAKVRLKALASRRELLQIKAISWSIQMVSKLEHHFLKNADSILIGQPNARIMQKVGWQSEATLSIIVHS